VLHVTVDDEPARHRVVRVSRHAYPICPVVGPCGTHTGEEWSGTTDGDGRLFVPNDFKNYVTYSMDGSNPPTLILMEPPWRNSLLFKTCDAGRGARP
jgi:hypothetical protein